MPNHRSFLSVASALLAWLTLVVASACSLSHSSVACDCVPPGTTGVTLDSPATVVVTSGPCMVALPCGRQGYGGSGGFAADAGPGGCVSYEVRATAAGSCTLRATFDDDGSTATTTIQFKQVDGDCCPGLHTPTLGWSPAHP